jgi:hypothetical protein
VKGKIGFLSAFYVVKPDRSEYYVLVMFLLILSQGIFLTYDTTLNRFQVPTSAVSARRSVIADASAVLLVSQPDGFPPP